jgi:hypothetical protein
MTLTPEGLIEFFNKLIYTVCLGKLDIVVGIATDYELDERGVRV